MSQSQPAVNSYSASQISLRRKFIEAFLDHHGDGQWFVPALEVFGFVPVSSSGGISTFRNSKTGAILRWPEQAESGFSKLSYVENDFFRAALLYGSGFSHPHAGAAICPEAQSQIARLIRDYQARVEWLDSSLCHYGAAIGKTLQLTSALKSLPDDVQVAIVIHEGVHLATDAILAKRNFTNDVFSEEELVLWGRGIVFEQTGKPLFRSEGYRKKFRADEIEARQSELEYFLSRSATREAQLKELEFSQFVKDEREAIVAILNQIRRGRAQFQVSGGSVHLMDQESGLQVSVPVTAHPSLSLSNMAIQILQKRLAILAKD